MPIGPTSGFLDFTNATPRANVIIALSNVGVGTDLPLHALDIRGTANVADIIINNDLTLVGGLTTNTLTINSVSMSTTSNFQQVTNVGDAATTNTVQFTNPTTGFTVSSNAEVGGELSVSGNTVVSSNLTVSGNVGIGTTEPTESLDIVGNLNLQKVSNTASIKLNSNVVTEYVRSKKSLIKYPRVAMTAATTSGYTASASSDNNGIRPAYLAFDNILYSSWHEPVYTTNPYPNADGAYTGGSGTVYDTNGYEGEYLQIQLPEKIKLYSYSISNRPNSVLGGRQPKDAKIFASNDGSTWIDIHTHSDLSGTYNTDGETRTFQLDNITETYYTYYRLVVNSIIEGGASDTPNTSQWQLYGTPEYDPEAHGTDVIMRSVPNVPNTDWLEVYYDGQDYTSMPSTVTDKSGNSVTGTPNGGVGFDTEYKAFTFDGTGDIRSTVSTFSGDQPHTMSTWVYISSALDTTDGYICVLAPSTGENVDQVSTIRFQNDGFNMQSWGNDIQMYNLGIQKERWYHLTAVYDGGGVTTTSKRLYINGVQNLTISNDATSGNTINFTNTTLSLGSRVDGAGSHLKGSIANFRLFNRALTGDEIWQLYAYQKDYFQVSPDVVTFKGGRLGIGTSEPRAPLDVMGIPYGPGARPIFSAYESDDYSVTATGYIVLGNTFVNGLNCYNTSTGIFVAPLDGIYCFIGNCVMRSSGGSGNSTWTFHINGTNWNPTSTGRPIAYQAIDSGTNHQQTSGSLIFYLNKSDSVRIYALGIPSNTNQNWGQGYGRFLGFLLS